MKSLLSTLLVCVMFSSCAVTTSYDDKGNVTQTVVDPVTMTAAAAAGILTYDPCYSYHYWSYHRPHCERMYWFRPYSCGPYWR